MQNSVKKWFSVQSFLIYVEIDKKLNLFVINRARMRTNCFIYFYVGLRMGN